MDKTDTNPQRGGHRKRRRERNEIEQRELREQRTAQRIESPVWSETDLLDLLIGGESRGVLYRPASELEPAIGLLLRKATQIKSGLYSLNDLIALAMFPGVPFTQSEEEPGSFTLSEGLQVTLCDPVKPNDHIDVHIVTFSESSIWVDSQSYYSETLKCSICKSGLTIPGLAEIQGADGDDCLCGKCGAMHVLIVVNGCPTVGDITDSTAVDVLDRVFFTHVAQDAWASFYALHPRKVFNLSYSRYVIGSFDMPHPWKPVSCRGGIFVLAADPDDDQADGAGA